MDTYHIPGKFDLTPRRHHGYAVLLFIMGTLFPPLAVAARFGIGKDFWVNLLLTICGYIPGHGHNFYIQNIRNNKSHARTPKWVQRYGLVDTSEIRRKERKSRWSGRYKDRLPESTLEGVPYEEGQIPDPSQVASQENGGGGAELWRDEDESFYAKSEETTKSGRWHYPANFEDIEMQSSSKSSKRPKKDKKKDRWARTEDAYSLSEERVRRKKSKKKHRASVAESAHPSIESTELPEDPDGGHYGKQAEHNGQVDKPEPIATTTDDLLNHEL
ncbi:hypothetical protein M378DRAFT_156984 [Amanita muscaria Koide BX008]|uniref:Uncharacterized protein n=1 Tax=Amanita muscaria (strain Koide BX008) TaxID=946122 RepID=A0A0C2XJS6_AMAMK|nr:hypothetical protein M378DRAFT_156984 [Amanita muscaria Koide BX008]